MKIEYAGLTIEIETDQDGFPIVNIATNGGLYAENFRPTIEVNLNNVQIHDMFEHDDSRWAKEKT